MSRFPRITVLAVWLAFECGGLITVSSQSPPQGDSCVVDLVVLDKRGNRLTDVDKRDLRIEEDGVAQTIASVQKGTPRANESSTSIRPPADAEGSESDIYTNIALSSTNEHEQTILLVDLLNTPRTERNLVLDRLATLLQAPNIAAQHLTIYGLAEDLNLLQDHLSSPQTLLAAMSLIKAHASESSVSLADETGTTVPAPTPLREGLVEFLASVKEFAGFSQEPPLQDRRWVTLTALKTIARAAEGIGGRKSLIWFSSDFPCTTATVLGSGIYSCAGDQPDFRAVFQSLQEARLSVYPVNSSNMKDRSENKRSVLALERSPSGTPGIMANLPSTFAADLASRDMAMQQLADTTGGRNLKGSSLVDAVQIAGDDNNQFLEIRIVSTRSDKGLHTISANSTRRGSTTLYRHIYFGEEGRQATESPEAIHEEILGALGDRFQATGVVLAARQQAQKSGVELFIDPRSLSLERRQDGNFEVEFDVATATLSPSYRILTGNTNRVSKVLTSEELQNARRAGLMLLLGYAPHQHAQRVRALVRDAHSGRLGSIDIPLQCCNVLR